MTTSPWREIEAIWQGDTVFTGKNNDGAQIQVGKANGKGINPMEAVLVALAACTGDDILSIMNKKRQPLTGLKINARGLRAEATPRPYVEIQLEFIFSGEHLVEKDLAQAIQLSEEKYCSVGAMLSRTAKIHTSFKILPNDSEV
ncbi:MAG: OsmC family protein [Anaerolineales bacterium]|nr:OsmC family protein [Anaerolineales bacterium]